MKHALRERRQEREHREPEERRGRCENDQRYQAAMMQHVREPPAQLVFQTVHARRRDVFHAQRHERVDDDEKRERVQHETRAHALLIGVAPLGKCRDRDAEHERPEHARHVELDRVERHRVREIFFVDERRDERLIRRAAEGLRHAGRERQQQDVPDLHDVEEDEQRQDRRRRHLDVLRGQERLASIAAVGQHAADEHEEHERQALEEPIEAKVERRTGERLDHPVLRGDLHPRADARAAGAEPLHAEIAVGERRQHAAQRTAARRRSRSRGGSGDFCRGGFGQSGVLDVS